MGLGEEVYYGVFAVRALPATSPDQFISLRYADAEGQDHEVGMVRDLTDWPGPSRGLVEQALARGDMLLSKESLFPLEAHWKPKSESVGRILETWNVGPSDVVFIDDSPTEVAEVR